MKRDQRARDRQRGREREKERKKEERKREMEFVLVRNRVQERKTRQQQQKIKNRRHILDRVPRPDDFGRLNASVRHARDELATKIHRSEVVPLGGIEPRRPSSARGQLKRCKSFHCVEQTRLERACMMMFTWVRVRLTASAIPAVPFQNRTEQIQTEVQTLSKCECHETEYNSTKRLSLS